MFNKLVVEKLFSLKESVTNVTNVTNDTTLIPVSSGDIAGKLGMTPQQVGQILKTLGLQTKPHKVEGTPKRCIIFDQVKLDTLKRRYVLIEDDDTVTKVTKVTKVTGLNTDDELPDCQKCGLNKWAMTLAGGYACPCGHTLRAG
jgi:hypothetical protein